MIEAMGDRVHASERPPVIVLGGAHNALSIARRLGARGVTVYALNHAGAEVSRSRYARTIRLPRRDPFEREAVEYLCGTESDPMRGAVLLAASDEGLKLVAENRGELARKFRLDLSNPSAQLCLLDKMSTYEAASSAGVPTPRYWPVGTLRDVEAVRSEIPFPVIVKPNLTYRFTARFGRKFVDVHDADELTAACEKVFSCETGAVVMEKIPGPDSLLCSYYTYLDEHGTPLFDFTKRIIRRYPKNMGLATCHVTDVVPELKEPALRLFSHVGLRGVANVEFKLDERDGVRKLIECNARYTAANELVARSGIDIAWFVYCRVVGLSPPDVGTFRSGMKMWDPSRDVLAFLELRRLGELSLGGWIRSLAGPQTLPLFSVRDPWPSVGRFVDLGSKLWSRNGRG
jgi:predicted ATP-grasp superfamily ATP-dependent carboligase